MEFTLVEYLLAGNIAAILILSIVLFFRKVNIVIPDNRTLDVKIPDIKVPAPKVPPLKIPKIEIPPIEVPDIKVPKPEINTVLPPIKYAEKEDRFKTTFLNQRGEFDIYEISDKESNVVYMIAQSRKGDFVGMYPVRMLK